MRMENLTRWTIPGLSRRREFVTTTNAPWHGNPASAKDRPDPAPRRGPAGNWRHLNPRQLTPRQMSKLSRDLHICGVLSHEESAMLGFQAELHPDYDRTIGALTGERADPDRPRDYIALWERRLAFDRKYFADDRMTLERTRHILTVLRQIEAARERARAQGPSWSSPASAPSHQGVG
jgi:hypothetical protein